MVRAFVMGLLAVAVAAPAVHGATLVGHWTFENGSLSDLTGNFADGTLFGGAAVANGQLELPNGGENQYYRTGAYSGPDVTEKTLVSWVRLDDLSAGGGSALTFEKNGGSVFDGIVYAERVSERWMAGSDNWLRTEDVTGTGAVDETLTDPHLIQMAITYEIPLTGFHQAAIFRNGQPYGDPYDLDRAAVPTFTADPGTDAIFGWRHGEDGQGGGSIHGSIEEARIYSGVLTEQEIAGLEPVSDPAGPSGNLISVDIGPSGSPLYSGSATTDGGLEPLPGQNGTWNRLDLGAESFPNVVSSTPVATDLLDGDGNSTAIDFEFNTGGNDYKSFDQSGSSNVTDDLGADVALLDPDTVASVAWAFRDLQSNTPYTIRIFGQTDSRPDPNDPNNFAIFTVGGSAPMSTSQSRNYVDFTAASDPSVSILGTFQHISGSDFSSMSGIHIQMVP